MTRLIELPKESGGINEEAPEDDGEKDGSSNRSAVSRR